MIQIDETIIRKLILHRVAIDKDKSIISDNLIDFSSDDETDLLKKIFLKIFFSHSQTFEFNHEIKLDYNVLFNLTKNIYEGDNFIEKSGEIAQHLISSSVHHNIKDGDFFVVKFDDIKFNNKYYEGLGVYKFEDKDSFIETSISNRKINFTFHKGIGNKKPDKACLILFTEEPYTVLITDSNNETDYWQKNFINHKSKNDFINNTSNFLTLTKKFITNQIVTDFEVTKADQIDFLNRSVDYFKSHQSFDREEFETEVFGEKSLINSFQKFDKKYRLENDVDLSNNFEISIQVVKKQAKIFKSVLKLDKNFHIYIHGDRELIKQGIDDNGRKYYKIYYENEV